MLERAKAPITLEELDRVLGREDLRPPGIEARSLGHREYGWLAPGMKREVRVTTDPVYYEEHADNVELWSPGNELFRSDESVRQWEHPVPGNTLTEILNR